MAFDDRLHDSGYTYGDLVAVKNFEQWDVGIVGFSGPFDKTILDTADKVVIIKHSDEIDRIIDEGLQKFFMHVAGEFAEVPSGDFPPDADFAIRQAAKAAAGIWLGGNYPRS